MSALLYGLLGFGCIVLYDINNTAHNNDRMQSLYVVGAGLIGLAFASYVFPGMEKSSAVPAAVRIVTGVLAGVSFLLLVYVSLFTGGRTNWKRRESKGSADRWWEKELVTTGAYALCRHPSVWLMFFLSMLLVPAAGFPLLYAAAYSLIGLLLAVYEDINVFPVLMRGYDSYKKTTPFLFPTRESIRLCFNGKKGK